MDSWRVNVRPGVWLPAYVYSDEEPQRQPEAVEDGRGSRVRSGCGGYELKSADSLQEFTAIQIDAPTVRDDTDQARQLSPVQSQRRWELQAEENVLSRLTQAGLLAPAGEVDKVLETVVNNLEVTNHLTLDAEVHCRVLLTSPLESFTVGHTIVLSRGLIDVLPDEASLAMMRAHELAHMALGHPVIDTKFAFADRLMVADGELLGTVRFRHDAREELAADAKVIELLKNSPYKDKLANAGLFLRAIGGVCEAASEPDSAAHRRADCGRGANRAARRADAAGARAGARASRPDRGAASRSAGHGRSVERPAHAAPHAGSAADVGPREGGLRRHSTGALHPLRGCAGSGTDAHSAPQMI